jgi:Arc-like DNA binding domain
MAKRDPQDIVNLKVRFTEAMRRRIEEEAKRNHRSLNGEIVHRLATTFGEEGIELVQQFELAQKLAEEMVNEAMRAVREKLGLKSKAPEPSIRRRVRPDA